MQVCVANLRAQITAHMHIKFDTANKVLSIDTNIALAKKKTYEQKAHGSYVIKITRNSLPRATTFKTT
jgi:hypothetical protein